MTFPAPINYFSYRKISGISLVACSLEEASEAVIHAALQNTAADFHLVNTYTIACTTENRDHFNVIQNSYMNVPDGLPLVLFSKLAGIPLRQVRGPDLFRKVIDSSRNLAVRHFFLGGTEELLTSLVAKLENDYPGVNVAGWYSPPFRELLPEETFRQDKLILDSGANLVWVGLGTPKQDFEAARLSDKLAICTVPVGAAFDFVAETKVEAPVYFQKLGLEWFFRFATEPQRLWRRYTIGGIRFLLSIFQRR